MALLKLGEDERVLGASRVWLDPGIRGGRPGRPGAGRVVRPVRARLSWLAGFNEILPEFEGREMGELTFEEIEAWGKATPTRIRACAASRKGHARPGAFPGREPELAAG